jgi:hypothetical protein
VKKVEPHLEFLLEEKSAFAEGKEARELLFTDVFLSHKLKEAQNDVTLNAADRAIAASDPTSLGRGRRKPNFRPARHGPAAGPPYESRRSEGFQDFGFQGKKNGFQRPKKNFSNDRRYVPRWSFINSPSLPVISPPPSVGGRLRFFASVWASITDDPWVLDTISNGLDIDFISVPVQTARPRDIGMSVKMAAVCNAEIDSLLQKKAVVEIFDNSPGSVCAFFCISKSGDGLFRPIVNLRPLNSCIRYEHFKMENLNSERSLLRGLYG